MSDAPAPRGSAHGSSPALLQGLSQIAHRYDFFVVDQWGCLHDGVSPHPGAREVLESLKRAGRPVALVSNSSRPAAPSQQILDSMGLPSDLYDAMITAGELASATLLTARERGTVRKVFSVLGPPGPTSLVATLGLEATEDLHEADVLVASGVQERSPDHWDALFVEASARGLVMLCLNPDLHSVLPDGRLVWCPGAFADRYASYGGRVQSWGKPHRAIYEAARAALGNPTGRGLGVGDSLHHDIQGAQNDGLDSVLIARGVHWEALGATEPGAQPAMDAVRSLAQSVGVMPTWVMPTLRW